MAKLSQTPCFWPGGVPAQVKCHAHPIPLSALDEEVKGWQEFLDERLEDGVGGTELDKRRHLVEFWATLTQAERDIYHDRAKPRPNAYWFPLADFAIREPPSGPQSDPARLYPHTVNLIGITQPITPLNHALWTKIRILLYRLDGVDDGPLFETAREAVPNPNGGSAAFGTAENFLMWQYVENTDFTCMAMTRTGTVVFYIGHYGPWILVDQEALATGVLLLCEFENNGQLAANGRIRPWFLYEFWPLIEALGKPLQEVLDSRRTWRFSRFNSSIDMTKPILEILDASSSIMDGPRIGRQAWMQLIERYAPGYLALEEAGQGMAVGYNHANFRTRDELGKISQD